VLRLLRALLPADEDGSRVVPQQGVDRNTLHQDGALLRVRPLHTASHRLQDGAQADHLPGVQLHLRAAAGHTDLHGHGRPVRALPSHAHGRQVRALPADGQLLPYGAHHRRQASALLHALLQYQLLHPLLQCLLQEVPSLPLIGRRPNPVRRERGEVENLASFAFCCRE